MGLRDEAERALETHEDERRAARRGQIDAERRRYLEAAMDLTVSFAAWCETMAIDEIPDIIIDGGHSKYGSGADSSYTLYFKFDADNLGFDGSFEQSNSTFKVQLVPDDGCIRADPISCMADLGHAIRKSHIRIPSHSRSHTWALGTWQGWAD